ncbi:UDP-glucose 4-epimerase GEPI48-like [Zingiber officinale]|uniref:UDP-glucose 4-epimerase n=1 Tax=Zingiber officinale TaxID=94328 RepID=A0A8J5M403_ZINOF|nr:UDP-glucose 4-epimerase GEPI48-like [Zingiber officinale]KAG6531118.1 hypothetical protein ZIOFF_004889 [Zingiber officinale]
MPGPVTMAVRNQSAPRVYIPASIGPGFQFHAPFSPASPSPIPFARRDSEDSCARRPRSVGLMPSSPFVGRTILVTGGAGYIGSHTVLQLLKGCFRVVVVDNLDNSSLVAVERVRELAGEFGKNLAFHRVDLRDRKALEKIFSSNKFDAVIHFAGLKAVGESVKEPLLYYNNNLIGTINLLEVMAENGCKKLVFSSSATVYGWPKEVPCTEEFPLSAMNPYGRTKLMTEDICRDICQSDGEWDVILLRYFNPVGAHPSGYIGEDPQGIPNNLMPFVQQVAVGRRSVLTVYGNDYSTKDGTGVRDYIHVVDLAEGHIAALQKIFEGSKIGCEVYNLGTGRGTSVLEMVAAFEKASGKKIPLLMAARRPGDAAIVYASTAKAEKELRWKAKYGIEEMCQDQWNWASKNPWGFGSPETANENQPTCRLPETTNAKHHTGGLPKIINGKHHIHHESLESSYWKPTAVGLTAIANKKHATCDLAAVANGKYASYGPTETTSKKHVSCGPTETTSKKHVSCGPTETTNVEHVTLGSFETTNENCPIYVLPKNGKHFTFGSFKNGHHQQPIYGLSEIANGKHITFGSFEDARGKHHVDRSPEVASGKDLNYGLFGTNNGNHLSFEVPKLLNREPIFQ